MRDTRWRLLVSALERRDRIATADQSHQHVEQRHRHIHALIWGFVLRFVRPQQGEHRLKV